MKTKVCRDCNAEKDENEFRKNSRQCRKCEALSKKEYYKKIRERKLEYSKNYRLTHQEFYKEYRTQHKEKMKKVHQDYYRKNQSKIIKKNNEYQKNRKKYDNVYKIKRQIRGMIRLSFTRKGLSKSKKTEDIVGCKLDYLYEHLLKTFKDNYGYDYDKKEDVHIDHIIPLVNAKTEQQVIELCHYSNLQLLKGKDNLEKNTKLNWELSK